jgi:small subunit ribosomal protein S2e
MTDVAQPKKEEPTATGEGAKERGKEGFKRGFGDRGGRGGRGGGPGGRGGRPQDKEDWIPMTKLGRLVRAGKIKTLEEIYTHSIPIKEAPIIDKLLETTKTELSDDVMKIMSVQKQTKAGQRTRFKAVVAVGDHNGHVGLGVKVAKEV